MNHFIDEFCEFSPQSDEDAALRFSLSILMLDHRTAELLKLLKGGDKFGGVAGDPAWVIERREADDVVGYEAWPKWARFRAYVEPRGYELAHPEFYADTSTFRRYAETIVEIYERRHPERSAIVR